MTWLFNEIRRAGDRLFCVSQGRSFSYRDLGQAIDAAERRLEKVGVSPGQVVAFTGDYSFSGIAVLLALFRRRNIVVPLTGTAGPDLEARVVEAGAEWLLSVDGFAEEFEAERRDVAKHHEVVAEHQVAGRAGLILFSSGSTGKPKGMLHDMEQLVEGYRPGRTKDHRVLAFMGIDHIGGLDMLFRALASKSALIIPQERSPEGICRLIEAHRVDVLPTTPSFLNLLLLSEAYRNFDLSSLRIIGFGAEGMPEAVLERLREVFPNVRYQQKFGTSETNAVRTVNKPDDPLWIRIEDDAVEWKIVEGELWLKTPSRILGYLNHSSDQLEEEGWFRTGDLVEEKNGYFRIVGRVETVINVGGEKVLPGEVEAVIRELPEVADCRVYGAANPILGQVVEAEVMAVSGGEEREIVRQIRRHCRKRLAPFKVPVKIRLVAEFALTERGKKR